MGVKQTALELLNLSEALVNLKDQLDGLGSIEEDLLFETIKEMGQAAVSQRAGALNKGAITICGLAYSIQKTDPSNWPKQVVEKKTRISLGNHPDKIIERVVDSMEDKLKDLPTSSEPVFPFSGRK